MKTDDARRLAQRGLNNEKAARSAAEYLRRVTDDEEPLSETDVFGSELSRAERVMLEGNGPTVYATFVFDADNTVDYVVFEHHDFDGAGYHVLTGLDGGDALYAALQGEGR